MDIKAYFNNRKNYGSLRLFKEDDAYGMLEWMHDAGINSVFSRSFAEEDMKSVLNFIEASRSYENDLHLAVTDNNDEYLGTISLKGIDFINRNAEYAISTRRKAHGTGIAKRATLDILRYAFEELRLNKVYLNVKASNKRAIAFYEKVGFFPEGVFREHVKEEDDYADLLWFGITSADYQQLLQSVANDYEKKTR